MLLRRIRFRRELARMEKKLQEKEEELRKLDNIISDLSVEQCTIHANLDLVRAMAKYYVIAYLEGKNGEAYFRAANGLFHLVFEEPITVEFEGEHWEETLLELAEPRPEFLL